MRIAFIETSSITNEVLRAYADAHPLCVGYPDGVPETWRTVSAAQQEAGKVPDLPMKHFTDETPKRPGLRDLVLKHGPVLVVENSEGVKVYPENWGGVGGGAAHPEGELDPAALLGPAAEPYAGDVVGLLRESPRFRHFTETAAMRQQAESAECGPVDWPERDAAGDEEC